MPESIAVPLPNARIHGHRQHERRQRTTPATIALALASFVCWGTADAADYGLTASVGTTGLSVHVSRALAPGLNVRLGPNFFRYSTAVTTDVTYDLTLKLRTFDVLLDYFPASGRFRMTAGAAYNGNRFDIVGRPNAAGNFTLFGNVYSAPSFGNLDGTVDFRRVAPYLGIGWGNPVATTKGWGFSTDVGVLFQGSPRSKLANTGCTAPALVCAKIAADVAAENRRLNEELKEYKYFPVVRFGARYSW